jgi:GTP-binding protein LepA
MFRWRFCHAKLTNLPSTILSAGEVGYVVTNLKDISLLTVGDTLTMSESFATTKPSPLPGYQPIKPVVFISFYPTDGDEIHLLRSALDKLKLEDSALQFTPEFSPALGNGFQVGWQ